MDIFTRLENMKSGRGGKLTVDMFLKDLGYIQNSSAVCSQDIMTITGFMKTWEERTKHILTNATIAYKKDPDKKTKAILEFYTYVMISIKTEKQNNSELNTNMLIIIDGKNIQHQGNFFDIFNIKILDIEVIKKKEKQMRWFQEEIGKKYPNVIISVPQEPSKNKTEAILWHLHAMIEKGAKPRVLFVVDGDPKYYENKKKKWEHVKNKKELDIQVTTLIDFTNEPDSFLGLFLIQK